jgi:hypothetical protein
VRAVSGAGAGPAKVTLSFAACEEVDIAPATVEIPFVAAPDKTRD